MIAKADNTLGTGHMPNTDFHYEEFEGLLASYYLSLAPLRDSSDQQDKQDFEIALGVLNGLAERHKVQKPEDAINHPRPTKEDWGQAKMFSSCFSFFDMFRSFSHDFGIGCEPSTVDRNELCKLTCSLVNAFERRGILKAEFKMIEGKPYPFRIKSWDKGMQFAPLA